MSWCSSGYWMVFLGWTMRTNVWSMPLAMPQPGTRDMTLILRSPCRELLDDEDGAGGDERVEQRDLDQPLPREAHELVDAHSRQRAAHPDEDEGERECLDHEPEQADDDLERQERPGHHGADGNDVEQHERDDERLQEAPAALDRPQRDGQAQDEQRHADDKRPEQPDIHACQIERGVERDVEEVEDRARVDWRVPAAEEQRDGERRQDENSDVLGEEEEAEAHAAVFGREARDDLAVRLGQVERRSVSFSGRGDEEDD